MESSNEPIGVSKPQIPGNERMLAIFSIVFGVLGLGLMLFGLPCMAIFSPIGLILGYFALKDPEQKALATVGLAISGLELLLVCAFFGLFALLSATNYSL